MKTKKFWIYQLRWQISAVIMFLPMLWLTSLGFPLWITLSIGQLFGALVFWKIDLMIFKGHKTDNVEDTIEDTLNNIIPTEPSVSDRKL